MIAVIFELEPKDGKRDDYLGVAAGLKSELEGIDGFLSIERFESLSRPGRVLSLSFWRDEEAVRNWRNLESHRSAQALGRNSLFADYRLRVAQVIRDYGLEQRDDVPADSLAVHDGE